MVSRPNWNVNGQRRWVCFWTVVCWALGRDGVPERPSCKYPASKLFLTPFKRLPYQLKQQLLSD